MFRPSKNPKEQPQADDTADHTRRTPAPPPSGNVAGSAGQAGASASTAQGSTQAASGSNRAVTESESLARDIKEGTLTGFVGNGTALTGEANFKGMLRVDGHLSGRVSSDDGTLIISTNGQVDANIEVAVAQIYGTVNGDVIATKRIEMGRVAKVTGNIQTPALVIESGAIFEGSCRMSQPKAQARPAAPSPSVSTPAPAPAPSAPSPSSSSTASSGLGSSTSASSPAGATRPPTSPAVPPKPPTS